MSATVLHVVYSNTATFKTPYSGSASELLVGKHACLTRSPHLSSKVLICSAHTSANTIQASSLYSQHGRGAEPRVQAHYERHCQLLVRQPRRTGTRCRDLLASWRVS